MKDKAGTALVAFVAGMVIMLVSWIFIETRVSKEQCDDLELRLGTVNLVYAGWNDGCRLADDL